MRSSPRRALARAASNMRARSWLSSIWTRIPASSSCSAPSAPTESRFFGGTGPPAETYGRRFGESAAETLGVAIDAVIEVGGWGVLKRYVEAGFGLSVVPSLVLSETDRLAVVALERDDPPRSFGVYARRDRHLAPAARRFLKALIPGVGAGAPRRG